MEDSAFKGEGRSLQVDIPSFARDLETLFLEINNIDSEVIISGRNQTLSANVVVDDAQINRLLLEVVRVGEVHGIRFPRCVPATTWPRV